MRWFSNRRRTPVKRKRFVNFRTEPLEPRYVLDGVIISEFLASNDNGIVDEDGEEGDWIELLNTSTTDQNLSGWKLRDSGATWTIPNVTLSAGDTLLVWATDKNRTNPARELHANFRISASGEYLALLRPDNSVAFEYAPAFPPQVPDVSYGVPTITTTTTLIAEGTSARVLVPTNGSLDAPAPNETPPWTMPTFDDSAWTLASQGLGFETDPTDPPPQPVIADSAAEFSRFQGLATGNFWRYGYWNRGADANGVFDYATLDFTQFLWLGSTTLSQSNHWGGDRWSLAGQTVPKTTELNPTGGIPSGGANVHAAVRRWDAEVTGPIRIRGELADLDPNGDGVSIRILVNGVDIYTQTLNNTTQNYTIYTTVNLGDRVDFMIDPGPANDGVGDATRFTIQIEHLTELPPPNLAGSIGGDAASNLQSQMLGSASSAYIRIPFNVVDASAFEFLKLKLNHDAGYVAYLNGVEVARANAPGGQVYNSEATLERPDADALVASEINLSSRLGILVDGANVLAIHGINSDPNDADFLISASLEGSSLTVDTSTPKYFVAPTPDGPNGLGTNDVGPVVAGVTHSPQVPLDNEDLLVTAYVAPTFDAVASVQLRYRVMFGAEVTLTMFDDGLHGDGIAGDRIYGASIPASAASPGQMIRYYVRATDATNDVTRFPLYEVVNDSEQYRGTVVHDPSINSDLPVFHWFVENAASATSGGTVYGSIFYNGEFYDTVRTDQHGQSTTAFTKKSFDVDFPRDHRFELSPDLPRMKDFNWLSNWADRTKVRNTLSYETFRDAGSAYHLAFPVRIQQNGQFFSIADFVEDGDDRFLERIGRNPEGALYKIYNTFTTVTGQEKKSRRWEVGTADLQAFLNGVNLTGTALTNFLYDNVNLPSTITYLAAMAITENTDCCHKNHYLYRDVPVEEGGTGEWEAMPWDVDLSFGHTWNRPSGSNYLGQDLVWDDGIYTGNNNNFISKVFANPQMNQMYLRRIRTLMDELLQPPGTPIGTGYFAERINELKALLGYDNYATQQFNPPAGGPPTPSLPHDAHLDRMRWGVWGNDQDPSPTVSTQEWTTQVQRLINEWLPNRRNFLYGLGTIPAAQPANANVSIVAHDARPTSGNQDQEYIEIRNANAYAVDISDWTVSGDVEHTFAKGTVIPSNTSLFLTPWSPAFRARTVSPRGNEGRFVQGGYEGKLSARGGTLEIRDKTGRLAMAAPYTFGSIATPEQNSLRITEIMYNPAAGTSGLYASDDYEFIELRNTGATTLNLTGVHFSEGIDFDFTGSAVTSLAPGASVLVVKNLNAFAERNGTAGLLIAGEFTGQLANEGERIRLEDAFNEMILDFDYEDDWHPVTDGSGFSLNVIDATADFRSWDSKLSWRPSQNQHGSPGTTDTYTLPPAGSVVISEVLANSSGPMGDWIELHNTTANAIDISGWWLSDDESSLQQAKYQIPAVTILAAGAYMVFNQRDHFGAAANPANPFALSSLGDEVVLTAGTIGGSLNGYQDVRNFAASEPEISFGRFVNSAGDVFFPAMATATPGAANSAPLVGPVVISEIMYNPVPGGTEFIELFNRSAQAVPLFDPANPFASWRFTAGIEFAFPPADGSNAQYPAGVTLAPGERAVIVEGNAEAFRTARGLPASLKIFSFSFGNLANGGERVELSKPFFSGSGFGEVVVDRIDYLDAAPWPIEADGQGSAMGRLVAGAYANEPTNWRSTNIGGTPGSANVFLDITPPTTPTNVAATVAGPTRIDLSWSASSDPETGIGQYRIYRDDVFYGSTDSTSFSDTGVLPGISYSYRVSAVNGGGTEGALSAPTPGTIIMSIQSASAALENRVRVVFSETVQAAAASNPANYAIDGGVRVLAAALSADNRSVLLTTTALAANQTYQVTAVNVVAASGRTIAPNSSVAFALANVREGFTVRHVNKAGGAVGSLDEADALLALPAGNPGIASQASNFYPTVNFRDDDGIATAGYFPSDVNFPANTAGNNNDFAVRATGAVTIPANAAGAWTFAVGIKAEPIVAIPVGSTWRYLDNGSDQGTAWTASGYNDTPGQNGWKEGPAELGYGDGDEATVVGFGGDTENRYVTTYFRKAFTVANPAAIVSMAARVLRDDGVALYLNGVEIARNNLAPGAAYNSLATATVSGADETTFLTFSDLNLAPLVAGTNVLAVEVHQVALNSSDISFDLELLLSTVAPPPAPTVTTIVPTGSVWKYRDDGTNQGVPANGTAWFGHPDFNDGAWASGPAQLGYGDGDEATRVRCDAANSTTCSSANFTTTYFRRQFTVADPSQFAKLALHLLRDDGAAVYLNGVEIARNNLAPNATFDSLATGTVSGAEETTQFLFFDNIDASLLRTGTNTLAVEVHQVLPTSSDLSFDLRLEGSSRAADDGVRLRIGDQDVIVAGMGTSPVDRFGAINLPAGTHELDLVFFERDGGAQLELFAAPGNRSFFSPDFKLVGDVTNGGLAVSTTGAPPNQPPVVIDVLASGSTWTAAYLAELAAQGLGDGGVSLVGRPTTGAAGALHWTTLDQIKVRFGDDVVPSASHLNVYGVNVADYAATVGLAPGGFSYDAATRTATWTFNAPFANDALRIVLDDALVDVGGASLDGEWIDGVSTFSGDGSPGGDLRLRFDVVPGDLNRSGQTTLVDVHFGRLGQFAGIGHAAYDPLWDADGNGLLNIVDLTRVRNFQGRGLPAGTPGGAPAAAAGAVVASTQPTRQTTARRTARTIGRITVPDATDAALSAMGEELRISRATARRLHTSR